MEESKSKSRAFLDGDRNNKGSIFSESTSLNSIGALRLSGEAMVVGSAAIV